MKSKSGFTLVELLVTIAIVGVLMGVVVAVLNPAMFFGRGRDSRRLSNLAEIQTTLELDFAEENQYPADAYAELSGLPQDPDSGNYDYCVDATFMNYVICATMETTPLPDDCTGADHGCPSVAGKTCCLKNPF